MGDDEEFGANLAEEMEEEQLTALVGDLLEDFEDDSNSRRDWMQTYVDERRSCGNESKCVLEPSARSMRVSTTSCLKR